MNKIKQKICKRCKQEICQCNNGIKEFDEQDNINQPDANDYEQAQQLEDSLQSEKQENQSFQELNQNVEEILAKLRMGQVNEGLEELEQLIFEIQEVKSPSVFKAFVTKLVKILNAESVNSLNLNQFQKSLWILMKCDNWTQPQKFGTFPSERALTLNNYGCYFRRVQDLPNALNSLEKALRLLNVSNIRENLGLTHLNLCAVLSQMGEHQAALENAKKAVIELHKDYQDMEQRGASNQLKQNPEFIQKVTSLAIAFHNVGVEEEYFQNYELSILNYGNSCQIAEENLGQNHRLTKKFKDLFVDFTKKLQEAEGQKFAKQNRFAQPQGKSQFKNRSYRPATRPSSAKNEKQSSIQDKLQPFSKAYNVNENEFYFKGKEIKMKKKGQPVKQSFMGSNQYTSSSLQKPQNTPGFMSQIKTDKNLNIYSQPQFNTQQLYSKLKQQSDNKNKQGFPKTRDGKNVQLRPQSAKQSLTQQPNDNQKQLEEEINQIDKVVPWNEHSSDEEDQSISNNRKKFMENLNKYNDQIQKKNEVPSIAQSQQLQKTNEAYPKKQEEEKKENELKQAIQNLQAEMENLKLQKDSEILKLSSQNAQLIEDKSNLLKKIQGSEGSNKKNVEQLEVAESIENLTENNSNLVKSVVNWPSNYIIIQDYIQRQLPSSEGKEVRNGELCCVFDMNYSLIILAFRDYQLNQGSQLNQQCQYQILMLDYIESYNNNFQDQNFRKSLTEFAKEAQDKITVNWKSKSLEIELKYIHLYYDNDRVLELELQKIGKNQSKPVEKQLTLQELKKQQQFEMSQQYQMLSNFALTELSSIEGIFAEMVDKSQQLLIFNFQFIQDNKPQSFLSTIQYQTLKEKCQIGEQYLMQVLREICVKLKPTWEISGQPQQLISNQAAADFLMKTDYQFMKNKYLLEIRFQQISVNIKQLIVSQSEDEPKKFTTFEQKLNTQLTGKQKEPENEQPNKQENEEEKTVKIQNSRYIKLYNKVHIIKEKEVQFTITLNKSNNTYLAQGNWEETKNLIQQPSNAEKCKAQLVIEESLVKQIQEQNDITQFITIDFESKTLLLKPSDRIQQSSIYLSNLNDPKALNNDVQRPIQDQESISFMKIKSNLSQNQQSQVQQSQAQEKENQEVKQEQSQQPELQEQQQIQNPEAQQQQQQQQQQKNEELKTPQEYLQQEQEQGNMCKPSQQNTYGEKEEQSVVKIQKYARKKKIDKDMQKNANQQLKLQKQNQKKILVETIKTERYQILVSFFSNKKKYHGYILFALVLTDSQEPKQKKKWKQFIKLPLFQYRILASMIRNNPTQKAENYFDINIEENVFKLKSQVAEQMSSIFLSTFIKQYCQIISKEIFQYGDQKYLLTLQKKIFKNKNSVWLSLERVGVKKQVIKQLPPFKPITVPKSYLTIVPKIVKQYHIGQTPVYLFLEIKDAEGEFNVLHQYKLELSAFTIQKEYHLIMDKRLVRKKDLKKLQIEKLHSKLIRLLTSMISVIDGQKVWYGIQQVISLNKYQIFAQSLDVELYPKRFKICTQIQSFVAKYFAISKRDFQFTDYFQIDKEKNVITLKEELKQEIGADAIKFILKRRIHHKIQQQKHNCLMLKKIIEYQGMKYLATVFRYSGKIKEKKTKKILNNLKNHQFTYKSYVQISYIQRPSKEQIRCYSLKKKIPSIVAKYFAYLKDRFEIAKFFYLDPSKNQLMWQDGKKRQCIYKGIKFMVDKMKFKKNLKLQIADVCKILALKKVIYKKKQGGQFKAIFSIIHYKAKEKYFARIDALNKKNYKFKKEDRNSNKSKVEISRSLALYLGYLYKEQKNNFDEHEYFDINYQQFTIKLQQNEKIQLILADEAIISQAYDYISPLVNKNPNEHQQLPQKSASDILEQQPIPQQLLKSKILFQEPEEKKSEEKNYLFSIQSEVQENSKLEKDPSQSQDKQPENQENIVNEQKDNLEQPKPEFQAQAIPDVNFQIIIQQNIRLNVVYKKSIQQLEFRFENQDLSAVPLTVAVENIEIENEQQIYDNFYIKQYQQNQKNQIFACQKFFIKTLDFGTESVQIYKSQVQDQAQESTRVIFTCQNKNPDDLVIPIKFDMDYDIIQYIQNELQVTFTFTDILVYNQQQINYSKKIQKKQYFILYKYVFPIEVSNVKGQLLLGKNKKSSIINILVITSDTQKKHFYVLKNEQLSVLVKQREKVVYPNLSYDPELGIILSVDKIKTEKQEVLLINEQEKFYQGQSLETKSIKLNVYWYPYKDILVIKSSDSSLQIKQYTYNLENKVPKQQIQAKADEIFNDCFIRDQEIMLFDNKHNQAAIKIQQFMSQEQSLYKIRFNLNIDHEADKQNLKVLQGLANFVQKGNHYAIKLYTLETMNDDDTAQLTDKIIFQKMTKQIRQQILRNIHYLVVSNVFIEDYELKFSNKVQFLDSITNISFTMGKKLTNTEISLKQPQAQEDNDQI